MHAAIIRSAHKNCVDPTYLLKLIIRAGQYTHSAVIKLSNSLRAICAIQYLLVVMYHKLKSKCLANSLLHTRGNDITCKQIASSARRKTHHRDKQELYLLHDAFREPNLFKATQSKNSNHYSSSLRLRWRTRKIR